MCIVHGTIDVSQGLSRLSCTWCCFRWWTRLQHRMFKVHAGLLSQHPSSMSPSPHYAKWFHWRITPHLKCSVADSAYWRTTFSQIYMSHNAPSRHLSHTHYCGNIGGSSFSVNSHLMMPTSFACKKFSPQTSMKTCAQSLTSAALMQFSKRKHRCVQVQKGQWQLPHAFSSICPNYSLCTHV